MQFHLTGRLSECLLLAYRTPAQAVQHLLPPRLQLVTEGPWAFWNIVACRVECIRPRGLATPFGITYHHVGYRLYVRARLADDTEKTGLFFVHSDADSSLVSVAGNWFSDFRFHFAKIHLLNTADIELRVRSREGSSDAELVARKSSDSTLLPGSAFTTVERREAILKYKPEAFSIDRSGRHLKIACVHRDETKWRETALSVIESRWGFLDSLNQQDRFLERATRVEPIDYKWSLGHRLSQPLNRGDCE